MAENRNQSSETKKIDVESGISAKYLGFAKKMRNMYLSGAYDKELKNISNIHTNRKETQTGIGY